MKKKSKIVLFALLGVAVIAIVVAAGIFIYRYMTNIARYIALPPDSPYYETVKDINDLNGYAIVSSAGEAAVVAKAVTDGTDYGIYDFAEGKFLLKPGKYSVTREGNNIFSYYRSDDSSTTRTYTVLTRSGTVVSGVTSFNVGLVCDDIYKVTAGESTYYADTDAGKTTTIGNKFRSHAPTGCDYATDNYIVEANLSSGGGRVDVYSRKTFEFVRSAHITPYVNNPSGQYVTAPLGNGNIFYQYFSALPDTATDYDFYAAGSSGEQSVKYDLRTYVINIGNGTVAEKNVDFVIEDISNAVVYPTYADYYTGDNLMSVYEIRDRSLCTEESAVFVSNNLGVQYRLDSLYYGVRGVTRVGGDRYVISASGRNMLIDGGGKVLAEAFSSAGGKYIGYDGTYYDLDLKECFKLSDSEQISMTYNDCVMITARSDGKQSYKLYDGKTWRSLGSVTNTLYRCGMYTVYADGKYDLYSVGSTKKLASADSGFSYVTADEDDKYVILKAGDRYFKATAPAK